MVFSSSLFLLYFLPLFLIIYYTTPIQYRNITALIGSVIFYAWGAPLFIFVLLLSSLFDYYLALNIDDENSKRTRRFLLTLSLISNIGLLAYFKYSNFFIENVSLLIHGLDGTIGWEKIALPIGISFFTFQKISYTIDVYRKVEKPLNKFSDYFLFVSLFPQLIAGPIVRFKDIANEITNRRKNEQNVDLKILGFFRFAVGLSKKVLIANSLGAIADSYFSLSVNELNTSGAWIAIMTYAFQIYFDFSGYSDMAIGLGKMMGFNFPENFNSPYISQSITEFWKRWHMTLGAWMKDYLYIPLGGNKTTKIKTYQNLAVVFILSGLWHGASWNFVIWGGFHGLLLIMERLVLLKVFAYIGLLPRIFITFVITLIGWVFFRIDNWESSSQFIKHMFTFEFKAISLSPHQLFIIGISILFSFLPAFKFLSLQYEKLICEPKSNGVSLTIAIISIIAIYGCISSISASGFNPFIYFQF